jgi:LemA family
LLALSERYPDLKADTQFARLSDELAGTENRIATERRRYNEAVQAYHTYVKSFPAVLTSGWFGFEPEKYFEAPKEAQQVPPASRRVAATPILIVFPKVAIVLSSTLRLGGPQKHASPSP